MKPGDLVLILSDPWQHGKQAGLILRVTDDCHLVLGLPDGNELTVPPRDVELASVVVRRYIDVIAGDASRQSQVA